MPTNGELDYQKDELFKKLTSYPPVIYNERIITTSMQNTLINMKRKDAVAVTNEMFDLFMQSNLFLESELKFNN